MRAADMTDTALSGATRSLVRWRRRIVALAGVAALVVLALFVHRVLEVGTGFFAKQLCSGVFVSQRSAQAVVNDDLRGYPPWIVMWIAGWSVDAARASVRANWLGLAEREARFAPGRGCTLAWPDLPPVAAPAVPLRAAADADVALVWPEGEAVELAPVPRALESVLAAAFEEPPEAARHTRAIVIVHRGRIVAERYAPGYHAGMPLPGWSMAKSVVNATIGALVQRGALALDDPLVALGANAVPAWSRADDPRRVVTVGHALQMRTGLAFHEVYANPLGDVTSMLFAVPDAAAYTAAKPLERLPGTNWRYASGTTNLLMHAVQQRVPPERRASLVRDLVFAPLGMASAVFEVDGVGTPIGSSFLYATARDWARLGLLYAQDGVWNRSRILPERWVDYSRTPVPGSSGRYGAHFWLVDREVGEPPGAVLPADAFHATGHAGQRVTIVPSRELVVVRLGLTFDRAGWNQERFVGDVLAALAP